MLTTWDAVSTLDRIVSSPRLSPRWFDDRMGSGLGAATNPRPFNPDIDVRTTEEELLLVCDVPGVKREDLDVTLHEHVLTIKGVRKFEGKSEEHVLIGRTYGAFSRAFTLPPSLDEEKLSADLADGVLTIRVPKVPKAKPLKVQIGGQ
jgi:HSP20 family protein